MTLRSDPSLELLVGRYDPGGDLQGPLDEAMKRRQVGDSSTERKRLSVVRGGAEAHPQSLL